MDRRASSPHRIRDENRPAIRDVDPDELPGSRGNEPVCFRKMMIPGVVGVHCNDLPTVNLLPRGEVILRDPGKRELFLIKGRQSRERLLSPCHDIDLRRSQSEAMDQTRECDQGRKSLEKGRGCHFAKPTDRMSRVNPSCRGLRMKASNKFC